LPSSGTAFLSVRDRDKPAAVALAGSLAALGFALCATGGTASALAASGLAVTRVRKVSEPGDGPTVVDLVRRRTVELVVNTPDGRGARSDGYLIREAALLARVPCVTTVSGAAAAVEAIARATREDTVSLQERVAESA
jgi:carbamoyl-phosphate synthase large subunit